MRTITSPVFPVRRIEGWQDADLRSSPEEWYCSTCSHTPTRYKGNFESRRPRRVGESVKRTRFRQIFFFDLISGKFTEFQSMKSDERCGYLGSRQVQTAFMALRLYQVFVWRYIWYYHRTTSLYKFRRKYFRRSKVPVTIFRAYSEAQHFSFEILNGFREDFILHRGILLRSEL